MSDVVRRLAWCLLLATAVAYSVFLLVGSAVNTEAASSRIVIIRDELSAGVHRLSGMVMVPSTCDQLLLKTDKVATAVYHLSFRTWQEPSIECVYEATPRAFRETVFAPAVGVGFQATLDDVVLPIAVYPTIRE